MNIPTFEGNILEGYCVCLTCYKSHLVVLKTNKPIMHSCGNAYLDEDEDDEFAEIVFDATCDIDSETNIHIDHQDD